MATGEERAVVARKAGMRWERRIVPLFVGVSVLVVLAVVDLKNVGVKGR